MVVPWRWIQDGVKHPYTRANGTAASLKQYSHENIHQVNMQPVSTSINERARKNEQLILRRLASQGQAPIAQALGTSESTVSRWKDGEFTRWANCLSLLGLKVVPMEYHCYDAKTIEALLTMARQRLDQIESVDQLQWEED